LNEVSAPYNVLAVGLPWESGVTDQRHSDVTDNFVTIGFLGDIAGKRFRLLLRQVRLSVTLRYRDHIRWNSLKIISRSFSLRVCSLQTPTSRIYSKGNAPKYWPAWSLVDAVL